MRGTNRIYRSSKKKKSKLVFAFHWFVYPPNFWKILLLTAVIICTAAAFAEIPLNFITSINDIHTFVPRQVEAYFVFERFAVEGHYAHG